MLRPLIGHVKRDAVAAEEVAEIKAIGQLRLTAPVFPGDTIYAESEVLEVRESQSRPTQGIVTVRTMDKREASAPKQGRSIPING